MVRTVRHSLLGDRFPCYLDLFVSPSLKFLGWSLFLWGSIISTVAWIERHTRLFRISSFLPGLLQCSFCFSPMEINKSFLFLSLLFWLGWLFISLFACLLIEKGSIYIALTVLKLTLLTRLASNYRNLPASSFWELGLKVCATTTSLSSNLSVTYDMYTEEGQIHLPGHTWNLWLLEGAKLLPPTPVLLHKLMMLWKPKGVRSCYSIKLEAEDLPASCSNEPWCQSVSPLFCPMWDKTLQNTVNWPRNSTPRHVS